MDDVKFFIKQEDGSEKILTLVTIFKAGSYDRDYCACLSNIPDRYGNLPLEIYRYNLQERADGSADMELVSIFSDLEYDEAVEALQKLLDEEAT